MIPEIRGNISESTPEVTGRVEGVRGPRGYSAYEVAVREGYVGTEEEWLASLVGPRGEKGDNGYTPIKGVDYFDGDKGDPGYTPQKGIDYTDGAKGEDGFSPTASVSKSGNTATITITDKNGTTTASVTDGSKGNPGQDGVSPSVVVNNITGGHQIIITDKTGNHSFNVFDGEDGTTPVITATKSGTVTTIYVNGTAIGTINDGNEGETGQSGVYVGESAPTDPDVNVWIDTDETGDDIVTDVQVNGSSVVSQGVANVPLAGTSQLGVVKFGGATFGVEITSGGRVQTARATSSIIKEGTQEYRPIVPYYQHESAFYGLTKAAGVDMASSSNPVGTYTDAAKVAIRKMLGASGNYEMVADLTTTSEVTSEDGITITFPNLTRQILVYADIKASTAQSNLYIVMYNESETQVIGLAHSGQINTTEKETTSEITMLGDSYISAKNTYTQSGLPPMYERIYKFTNNRTAVGFSSIIIRPQNSNANIPVGSVVRVFAK